MKVTLLLFGTAMAATAVLAIASCSNESKPSAHNTIEFTEITSSVRYKLDETAKLFNTDEDIMFRDSVDILFPDKLLGKPTDALRDSILVNAFDTIASPDEAIKAFFHNGVNELGYSFSVAPDSIPGNDIDGLGILNGYVFNMNSRILTYCISRYTYYPGAAHGITNTSYITYLLKEGRVLTLRQLFTPEGLQALPAIIDARAKQLKAAIGPTDKITSLPSNDNYYINVNDAITFVYQPYEVASYAQGSIQISFYPTELTEYLSPEALEYFQLN